ncbi:MAG: Rieske 2Fe-2S domain-containing protein [Methylococcales bacterium]
MAYEKLCTLDDVWEGDMDVFTTSCGVDVLILGVENGDVRAFQAMCPHQEIELVDGEFDGKILTCKAHLWQFDTDTGKGVNPKGCQLAQYPVKIDGDDIYVNVEGIEPLKSDC